LTSRHAEGIPYLERAYKTDPDSWAACFYLGKAKMKLDDGAAAISLLQQAADLNAEELSIFYLLGSALRTAGRTEEAKAAWQRVTQLHSSQLDEEKRLLRDHNVVGVR